VTAPRAIGVRLPYADVPARVRGWVDDALRSPVASTEEQVGGMSPGCATRVVAADGTRAFVKAVGTTLNPDSPTLFRREIGHYDFVGASQDPIRNSFPNLNSGNTLHRRIHALEMLNVHRGDHVYFGVEQLQNIFIALAMFAAFDIGVREFIDECDLRLARDNRVDIHLFEDRSFVFELFSRHGL